MVYSAMGGLTGVLLTDLIQFTGHGRVLGVLTLPEVGGLDGLLAHENVQSAVVF